MIKRTLLFVGNATMTVMWIRVLIVLLRHDFLTPAAWMSSRSSATDDADVERTCLDVLRPAVLHALAFSSIELFNSIVGLTRSKPHQVLLFFLVRGGVEHFVAPMIQCHSGCHIFTVACWTVGEIVRFGCFAMDGLVPSASRSIKTFRYTVGPILFPCGAAGEMFMVADAAMIHDRRGMWIALLLWPVGFFFLYTQLLKQRRKHMGQAAGGGAAGKGLHPVKVD